MMHILKKHTSFTMHACFILLLLLLLPYVSCSSPEHIKSVGNHMSNKQDNHKDFGYILQLSPQLSSEIVLHGFLLWASMGFLIPVGILAIRMSNREKCGRRLKILFYVHATSQTLSVLLVTAGAVMSIRNFGNTFNNTHQRLGAALYGVVWLQALIGLLRPQRGTKRRSVWFFVHWVLGTAVALLGIINIYTGLQAYHKKTSRSIRVWTIFFTCQVSFIVFFYLFQDKWEYMQKQGVILGNEPINPTDQEFFSRAPKKESVVEPC